MALAKSFEKIRLPLLVAVFGGTIAAWSIGSKTPLLPFPEVAPYTLPAQIPLVGWEPVGYSPLPVPSDRPPIAAGVYRYRQNGSELVIEVHYLTATKGDVRQFARWYTSLPENITGEISRTENIGSQEIFSHGNRLYLSSCIHPAGKTTVTGNEYIQNKLRFGTGIDRLGGWLIGTKTISDRRCLWSLLSLPIDNPSSLDATRQRLQVSWELWYDWWRVHYPTP
jgi:cyanosortase A-associated protein